MLGWRVRRGGRAAFAPGAIVRHHVFAPDPRASVSRAWMAGAFPALVREVPELRRSLLQWGVLLGPTRVPLYAGAVAAATRRRRAAAGLLGLWLIVSPWVLGFAHTRAMHFSIGVGATVTFLAALELWLVYDASHPESLTSEPRQKH